MKTLKELQAENKLLKQQLSNLNNQNKKISEDEETTSNKIGFLSLLTLLFIGLKLGNVISWSWWLVLMPLYLPLTLSFVLIIAASWLTGKKTKLTYKGKRIW